LIHCGVLAYSPSTFAVFASGAGSNFEALATAARESGFPGSIALLVSDEPAAPVIARARRLDVPSLVLPVGRYRTRIEDEEVWVETLTTRGIDAVLLAGFMRRLHAPLLDAFPDRILNVHPSLLPAFPGRDAIARAREHGVLVTGVTVHVVRESLDAGPIVSQAPILVHEDDTVATLQARVHAVEHQLYPAAVRRYFGSPHRIEGDRVVFAPAEEVHGG
jgi:phosphoribosylglycinamide formyltransferase-1